MMVCGRGLSDDATVTATATASGVTYRVDDDANPETWYELHLSAAELRAALGLVGVVAADDDEDLEDTTLAIEPGGE